MARVALLDREKLGLRVIGSDISDYDRIYRRLIRSTRLSDVSASFAMQQIGYTTKLPLETLE